MGKSNWFVIAVLFSIALPGVIIAIPRITASILKVNNKNLQRRFNGIIIFQCMLMVFFMSMAGCFLLPYTKLPTPILAVYIQNKALAEVIRTFIFPVLGYTLLGLILFLLSYFVITKKFLENATQGAMYTFRKVLGLKGCVLFGGIVEEILFRWGLQSLLLFFGFLFTGVISPLLIGCVILVSCFLITASYLPAFLAMGCRNTQSFKISLFVLISIQTVLFSLIFWQYGLFASIVSHMLFHAGWYWYDKE